MKKITLLVGILLMLVGCNGSPPEPEGPIALKVLAWNEDFFYERYGKYFVAVHPRYELDIVSVLDRMERPGENIDALLAQLIEQERPDLLVLPMNEFAPLREQNMLGALTPWIARDKLDMDAFAPAVLDYLQDDQELYGLAPVFTGRALYYNKQLFAEKGIPLPSERMTWEEVFALAQRFADTGEEGTIGLYHQHAGNPYLMALYVGEGNGLSLYQDGAITLHTEAWAQVFQHVLACMESGACSDGQSAETGDRLNREVVEEASLPFLRGNIAMAVEDSTLHRTIASNPERYEQLDWGTVPLPTSAAHPDLSNVVRMDDIFAIPTDAPQAEHAWTLIRYVGSEDYARLLPQLNPIDLPARVPDGQDARLQAFYALEQTANSMAESLRQLPYDVLARMDELSPAYIEAMKSGQMSVEDALAELEAELQAVYDAAAVD